MKKQATNSALKLQEGFYLTVDGQQFGPFLEKHRENFSDLKHRKGVEFTSVRQKEGWVEPPKKPIKTKEPHPALFDTAPFSINMRGRSKGWL